MIGMNTRVHAGGRRRLLLAAGAALSVLLVLVALVSLAWTPQPVGGDNPGLALLPASDAYWLGTDASGRDIVSLAIKGLFTSLAIPAASLLVAALIALPLGMLGARWARPRWIGNAGAGAGMPLSALFIAVIATALIGPSEVVAFVAVALASVLPLTLATSRALAAVQGRAYLDAARLAGLSRWEALRHHALHEVAEAVGAATCRLMCGGIAAETTISFVGMGGGPYGVSLGRLLRDAQGYAASSGPTALLALGLILAAAIGAFGLLAIGLRRPADAAP